MLCGTCGQDKVCLEFGKQANGMYENFWWCTDCKIRTDLIQVRDPEKIIQDTVNKAVDDQFVEVYDGWWIDEED